MSVQTPAMQQQQQLYNQQMGLPTEQPTFNGIQARTRAERVRFLLLTL